MACQKVSYLDALLLDISGSGEVVSSDLCDSSNVTVLEFLSGPIPTSSTVASPRAISCSSPEFALFVLFVGPHPSQILFPTFSPLGPEEIWELGEKEFCLSHTDRPLMVCVLPCLPFSFWVIQISNLPNTYQSFWHNP